MPPEDAFVKVEVVVKEEEEGLELDDWFCAGSHGRGHTLLPRDCAGRHRWERALALPRRRPSRRRLPLRDRATAAPHPQIGPAQFEELRKGGDVT